MYDMRDLRERRFPLRLEGISGTVHFLGDAPTAMPINIKEVGIDYIAGVSDGLQIAIPLTAIAYFERA